MKRIVRLSERDLTRIVRRVIKEQIGFIEILGRIPETGQEVTGMVGVRDSYVVDATDFDKSVSNLFYWAKKNTGPSDVDYKSKNLKLYNAMNGAGTTEADVKEVLGSLKNMNQLSKLVNNWTSNTGSSDSLYDWLIGDMYAEDIWKSIGSWKSKYTIDNEKKYKTLTA